VNYWGPFETLPGQSVVGGRMTNWFVGGRMTNWFATQWPDAWAAAKETLESLPDLTARTRTFRDALFDSTLPTEVLDAVSSQMSIIRTTTCLRTADGRFHAFEGCDDNAGCCPMNCTHVWNYAQALAFLFPQLERSVRLTDYQYNTLPDGEQKFRTMLPLQTGVLWNYVAAADGQMGTLMKLYREWLVSGDDAYLRSLWPQAKKTLAYAWQLWDPNRDGVMEGEQHNTYDIEFYGPNTMCGALYLGALRAAEEMARHLGDPDAAEYARICASGRARYDRELWNGEYYEQHVRMPESHEVQKGKYPPCATATMASGAIPGTSSMRPPLRPRARVVGPSPRPLGLRVQRPGPAAPLRAARGRAGLSQPVHRGDGVGHRPHLRAGGGRAGRGRRADAPAPRDRGAGPRVRAAGRDPSGPSPHRADVGGTPAA
jgi:hypothetical protein